MSNDAIAQADTETAATASDALGEVERRLCQRKGYDAEDVIRFALLHIEAWRKGVARISPEADTGPTTPEADTETVARVLEFALGRYLAHSPHNPDSFWRQAAESVLARFHITERTDR